MHVRSGDIFTAWRDGARTFTHAGYNSQMGDRGQPPLGFYLQAISHAATRSMTSAEQVRVTLTLSLSLSLSLTVTLLVKRAEQVEEGMGGQRDANSPMSVVLVTSPDRASPVVKALEMLGAHDALYRTRLRVSASSDFETDLRILLCARSLNHHPTETPQDHQCIWCPRPLYLLLSDDEVSNLVRWSMD